MELMRLIAPDFTVNIADLTDRPATHWHDLYQPWKISENQSHQPNQCSISDKLYYFPSTPYSIEYRITST